MGRGFISWLCFVSLVFLLNISFEGFSQTCSLGIRLVSDTVACRSEFPPPRGIATASNQFSIKLEILSGNPTSINWSNGDVGQLLRPDSAGSYEVIVTDISGCSITKKVKVSEFGIPNPIYSEAAVSFNKTCFGDTTEFKGIPISIIDSYIWSFGDGATSTAQNPKNYYASSGEYLSILRLTNRCGLDTTMLKQVSITTPPLKPTLPATVTLCNDLVILDADITNAPQISYLWSTGVTTKNIVVNEASFISATNTDVNRCSSRSTTIVVDNRPQVDLGPDISICQFSTTTPFHVQNPGMSYTWEINGATNGNTSDTQSINTSIAGNFNYSLKVTDPFTTCFGFSSTDVIVLSSPKPSVPTTASICNEYVTLDANSSGEPGILYAWSTGETSQTIQVSSSALISVTNLNQQSGCSSSAQILVTDLRPPKPSVTLVGQFNLRSSSPQGNQWFRNEIKINNETNQDLTVTESGSYSVQTTFAGCASIKSDNYMYTITALEDLSPCLETYPNPTDGYISLCLKNRDFPQIKITDLSGREIPFVINDDLVDIRNAAAGTYFLTIRNGHSFVTKRIVKR
ncbi:MAG: T9SS type A sorting domain-containing protein [Cytophagales bacterium]|nr:T9SS type A sorting domain-containing protein [Cytophagales bacterium]